MGLWCSFSVPSNGLLVPYSAGDAQTLSGYSDFYYSGSGIFPCVQKADTYYRGIAVFDLSQFGSSIVSASLSFTVDQSITPNGETVGQSPACNATTLGMGTMDPTSPNNTPTFDNPVSLPPCGPPISVGVSESVRQWISNPPQHANFGFILAGSKIDSPDDLPDDNISNVTWYGNSRLAVVYNPSQNPGAPTQSCQ